MRWVAAETPHSRTDAVTTDRQRASPARGVEDINTIAPPPVRRAHRLDVETPEPNLTPARTISKEVQTTEPIVAHAVPMPAARLTQSLPTPLAPVARDEVVEVSIGAIHVRVDAPQLQTVARPSASPPGPARRATASQARSALSRRALRRI
jgi:hypothetical protein